MLSLNSGIVAYFPLDYYSNIPALDGVADMVGPHDFVLVGGGGNNLVVPGPGNQPALSFPGGAGDVFVGSDELAKFKLGDSTFTLIIWSYLTSTAATRVMMAKSWDVAGKKHYQLWFNTAANRYQMRVYTPTDTTVDAVANNFGNVPVSTWHLVHGYHSAEDDEVGIRVDLGVFDTQATGAALQDETNSEFEIGTRNQGDSRWLGRLMGGGIWSRKVSDTEHAWLYNNGLGRTWPFGEGRGTIANTNRRMRRRRIA